MAAAGPIDGVYIANHGAMLATDDGDPDGTLMTAVRQAVGDGAAVIATLDLHANLSERMTGATDAIIGYQTNPHVDQVQRGEEAALLMRQMFAGMKPRQAMVRLPLTPPSVTLLTAAGPYGDLIDYGQRRARELADRIANVSVFGNFTFADCAKNGLSVVVTARAEGAEAQALANEIAARGWANRAAFKKDLMAIDDAVELAREVADDPGRPAVIFSDAGDNPGGGGEGRTTWLLAALTEAGARGVYYGAFFDPDLAAEAHELGAGAEFEAVFNRQGDTEFSKRFQAAAKVLHLHDGEMVGRLGIYRERQLSLGPCAALEIGGPGGIVVVVISARHQTADPMFFEMFGLDIAEARVVCVKSRGHFRAGFTPWFGPEQVHEVDTAGLTSPVLERFTWRNLPRPVYPLDPETEWEAGAT
ncbi:MAG: M81 family metallopeptidase [Alphaproteobacteria bacterium]|nr:M81 family metallopeptidase [Alphaproteobacteria bacterium]MDP6816146.1 M81 family metallopeptidase [Alphaproteobacteria bacterium]